VRVTKVIGISTRVIAAALMNGWYIATFSWRRIRGRWAYRVGISAIELNEANRMALEKDVKSGEAE
jgi:hypothetical protein